jgi:hypothetical protein
MSGFELRVKVTLSVVSAEKLPTPRPVVAGWGPTIAYRDKLFAGRILVCENPIQPADTGEAVVGILAVSPVDLDMDEGSHFDLKDGLLNLIATATVIDVISRSEID